MRAFLPALAVLLCVPPAFGKVVKIQVLHTNDIHGWILPRPDRKADGRMVGGAAALAAWVKKQRADGPTLLVDGGDWFQGTPEGSLSQGKAVAEVFDAVGFDATVPGNHEFDYGEAVVKELALGLKTPVLAANIESLADHKAVAYARTRLVKSVGGVKVGLFGLTTTNMKRLSFEKNIAGLDFTEEVAAARAAVAALKKDGAEVIVMLSHVGQEAPDRPPFTGDQKIAQGAPGIDLIVGGHVHVPLPTPLRVGGTLIVNTGCYLEKAGRAVLEYDTEAGKVVSSNDSLTTLWLDETGEDAGVKAVVERWHASVGKALDVVIATAAVSLGRDRKSDSPMGNWMTDCLRRWTKTDLAFQNAGGIRADLAQGPVRLRDIFEIMPFDNRVTTVYLRGSDLLQLFEHSVGQAPGVMQVSGATVSFDPSAPAGARVRGVEVRGRALEKDAVYSAAAADFIVQGGDGFGAFSAAVDRADHDTLLRDMLGWCARLDGTIVKPAGGRLKKL